MLFLRKNKKNIKDIIKKWDFNKNLKKKKYNILKMKFIIN